jgi:acetoin utilization deacetylase AcuC-like enzyme
MLRVVHHPYYGSPTASFDKYGLVMAALTDSGVPHEIHRPEPMPQSWIEAVHDPVYVAEVAARRVPPDKTRRIGFAVDEFVSRRAFVAPGGTWLAARLALEHGFAANAAGGSHHAMPIAAPAIACSTTWPLSRTGFWPKVMPPGS